MLDLDYNSGAWPPTNHPIRFFCTESLVAHIAPSDDAMWANGICAPN